jgi:Arc/MetJ family transcription regulator
MSTTKIEIDDDLLEKARSYVGQMDDRALAAVAFTALIQLKAGQWLARQGGTQPGLSDVPRRRWGME